MSREEYLKICLSKWEEMSQLDGCDNLYDLEKGVVELVQGLGRDLLEGQLGDVPQDRRKKKFTEQHGEIGGKK